MQNSIKVVVLFLFFASGVTGLIYEVVWIRMFGLVLGNTTYAISITLGAFFAGLALGSFYFGRFVDRITVSNLQKTSTHLSDRKIENIRMVRIYAFLELGIAISALLVGIGILHMQNLFVWINQLVDHSSTTIYLMRFILSFSILLIPTILMGATLPVLSKFLIRQYNEVKSGMGFLYGINTFGAALGCLLTGFYLIQAHGVKITIYTAVIINVIIAISVLSLEQIGFFNVKANRKNKRKYQETIAKGNCKTSLNKVRSAIDNDEYSSKPLLSPTPFSTIHIVLFGFGLSGFTSIAYEIIWARVLSSLFLNSIYSFTTMLVTFLTGLAIGSTIVSKLFNKKKNNALTLLGITELAIGLTTTLLIILFDKLPDISIRFLSLIQSGSFLTWNMNVFMEFCFSFMIMIMPCTLIGMTLPLASQIVTKDMKFIGQSIGKIYSVNTVGGILGALIVGCFLIPKLGVKFSELSMAGLNICIGIIFFYCSGKISQTSKTQGFSVKKIALPLFCVFTIGIGIFCAFIDVRAWNRKDELLYYNEDAAGSVSVTKEMDGNKKLIVNKKYTLGTSKAISLQKRMGYIPLLLHNNPQDVLVIGMGTGITLGAVSSYELTKAVNCIEVIKSVANASQHFFAEENNNVCKNKKTNIIIEDGRNYLLLNQKKYDVIISDLFVPYHAGAGSLYTKEHFELCKNRINSAGLFCQWLPLYQMSSSELKIICKTFVTVFPKATLWFCNFEKGLICGLIGTKDKLEIDITSLNKIMSNYAIRKQLKDAMIGSVEELLALFITDDVGLRSFTNGFSINSDNYPIIEFLAPKNIYEFQKNKWSESSIKKSNMENMFNDIKITQSPQLLKTVNSHVGINNLLTLYGLRKGTFPLLISNKIKGHNDEPDKLILNNQGKKHDYPNLQFDTKNIEYYSEAIDYLIAGILHFYSDMFVKAEDDYLTAWELAPNHLYLRKMFLDLSVIFYRKNNYDETIFINEKLINTDLKIVDPFSYFYLGLAYQAKGDAYKAISSYQNAIALNPPNKASIHYNLGIIYKTQGFTEKAIFEFKEAELLKNGYKD